MTSPRTKSRLSKLFGHLREPSTWAGLSIIGALFGLPPGTLDAITQLGIAIGATAAIFLPENAGA